MVGTLNGPSYDDGDCLNSRQSRLPTIVSLYSGLALFSFARSPQPNRPLGQPREDNQEFAVASVRAPGHSLSGSFTVSLTPEESPEGTPEDFEAGVNRSWGKLTVL